MSEQYTELVLKNKHSRIEFAWVDDDLGIDAENSDERVYICLNPTQAQELFDYLKTKCE